MTCEALSAFGWQACDLERQISQATWSVKVLTKPLEKTYRACWVCQSPKRHPDLTEHASGNVRSPWARKQFCGSVFRMQLLFQERQEFRGRKSSHFSSGLPWSLAWQPRLYPKLQVRVQIFGWPCAGQPSVGVPFESRLSWKLEGNLSPQALNQDQRESRHQQVGRIID